MATIRWLGWVLFATLAMQASADTPVGQEQQDWNRTFREADLRGTAVIFDESGQRWLFHDRERAGHAYSPASTFKVFNAMAALDSDAIKDEFEVIRWDGKERQYPIWNRDHSLASGMKYSVVWFYQEMARRIGAGRMKGWLDKVGYGNHRIGGAIDMFWPGRL